MILCELRKILGLMRRLHFVFAGLVKIYTRQVQSLPVPFVFLQSLPGQLFLGNKSCVSVFSFVIAERQCTSEWIGGAVLLGDWSSSSFIYRMFSFYLAHEPMNNLNIMNILNYRKGSMNCMNCMN